METKNIAILAGVGVALVGLGYYAGRSKADANATAKPESLLAASPGSVTTPSSGAAPKAALSAAAAAPSGSASAFPPDPTSPTDLFTRLEREKSTRLMKEPTAEHVFEALKTKLGVKVEEELQVAGWVVGARYCDKIRTKNEIHVVVCEYADESEAIAGQKNATNAMKRREVLRNKTTTCAVHQPDEGKEGAAEAEKIKELFKKL